QWLDSASAELLGFAARRLGDTPVQMLCAVRTEGQEYDRHLRACPPDTHAVRLGPFSRSQVSALLDHRGYTGLSRSTVRDIHRTSGGNPLFALELGRALAESPTRPRPGEPLPVPTSLRALVLSRLGMLSDEARRTLLVASAGARPTLALLHAAGRDQAEAETAQAAALGLLTTDPEDPALRFAHPLISAALYAEAPVHERRAVHTALSTAASDPIERARHLALATTGTDPDVAARPAGPRRARAGRRRLARRARGPAHPGRQRAGPGRAAVAGRRGRDHRRGGRPGPGHRPRGADPGKRARGAGARLDGRHRGGRAGPRRGRRGLPAGPRRRRGRPEAAGPGPLPAGLAGAGGARRLRQGPPGGRARGGAGRPGRGPAHRADGARLPVLHRDPDGPPGR